MTLMMYGIKNCDTIKKARHWLEAHQIAYQFHDYRVDGLEHAQLTAFIRLTGDWQPLLNTRGTTWRQLSDAERAAVIDVESAITLLLAHPALIKRPLLVSEERALLGFNAESYHAFTAEKE
ncbi:ArsC family reductase [Symbiopectobacterium sp.]|uniref:ArsC family reductase n=1 Tax=Symbiopectobacterium sp. TaxID=2952789 RepID=UPI003F2B15BF